MPTKTEAIKRFLESATVPDLATLYSYNMECQVNVSQDGGERVDGDFKGKKWNGWTDGLTTWKPFRVPWNAGTTPSFQDGDIKWDFSEHVDAIGMTGWDWQNLCSRWVAFDFDAIMGHSDKHVKGLSNEELEKIKAAAFDIDWVTIRKSTSGKGLHLYVFLDDIPTANHNEHAALARSILGKLSALTGYDFDAKVDNCGGNMWVWARKMRGTDGLTLIKRGDRLPESEVPLNWRDHVKVVTGRRRKNLPQDIEDSGKSDFFEQLTGQRQNVPLDDEHKKLINYLKETNATWWYDSDNHMLVCHALDLKEAHEALGMRGTYDTLSQGRDKNTPNCFCFCIRRGAWAVRRFTPGVQEHEGWFQDSSGWTTCYFNREPDLATACRTFGGLEDPSGGFIFQEVEVAQKAAKALGISFEFPVAMSRRKAKIKQHRDGRVIVEIDFEANDNRTGMNNWLAKKDKLIRIFNAQASTLAEPETNTCDDIIRHVVSTGGEDCGWAISRDGEWGAEPINHIMKALSSMNINAKDSNDVLGNAIFKPWKLVNKPFDQEYPGDREWNRNAAQLRFLPSKDKDIYEYPHWLSILQHCGESLNDAIKEDPWCRANGVLNGADYLKCWVASLFQKPYEPLPYLFFWGEQDSGKSIFHEALSRLMTKGYVSANVALTEQRGFNAELEGAILCVIEEMDLSKNSQALSRIKEWVTAKELLIHPKGLVPYPVRNTCHFCQVANPHSYCPILPGDTRITVCHVANLDPLKMIPKNQLEVLLDAEASDFLAEILSIELPPTNSRLNIPVISTSEKQNLQKMNANPLESFLDEHCVFADGYTIKISDFYEKFTETCDPNELHKWPKKTVTKSLPPQIVKGRNAKDGQWAYGNIRFVTDESAGAGGRYTIGGSKMDTLVLVT